MARPVTFYTVVPAAKLAQVAAMTFAKYAKAQAKTSSGYKLYDINEIKRVKTAARHRRYI